MSVITKDLGAATAYGYAVEKGYTGTEEEFAELMASYATVGQTAVDAKDAAVAAKTAAQTAATTATNKASEATTAATTATTKAGEAQTSAQTASSKASEASQSASQASGYAQTAETAKTDAQTAKTQAETARDNAVTAKTAAQTAQTAAETAQGAAEDAAQSVSASATQIAQNTSDIADVKSGLTQKANIDGSYEDLVSGGAYQIISNIEEVDNTPYGYRTAGGSLEIGDREKLKKIVGGSLVVNQLAKALVEGNYNKSSGTVVYDNGTVSFTAGAKYGALYCTTIKELVEYHKYLISAKIKMTSQPSANTVRLGVGNTGYNQGAIYVPPTASVTSFTEISGVVQYSYGTNPTNNYLFLQDNRAEISQIDMKNLMLIDLTAMFGTEIADYVFGLKTATEGVGVAWLKAHFPKIFDSGYIPYNAGTLEHVSGLTAHKMTGFNQLDASKVEWTDGIRNDSGEIITGESHFSNAFRVLPNTTYCINGTLVTTGSYRLYYLTESEEWISRTGTLTTVPYVFTTPSNCGKIQIQVVKPITSLEDVCINISSSLNGEYEPYEEHSYSLDSDVTLRGIPKLDANNNLYYDGDEYESDGTVTRRYGIVDLGTLNWAKDVDERLDVGYFFRSSDLTNVKVGGTHINTKYTDYNGVGLTTIIETVGASVNKILWNVLNGTNVYVIDSAYTDAATFKTAMSGVYLVYELATPSTESADPYTEIQNVSNWGTEEFVTTSLVPVGHETRYPENLRAKIEGLPWDFSSLIAPTEKTTTASRNYTAGSLLIMGNVLYKVTANIANGGTITVGTNVTATTLAEVIAALS